MPTYFATFFESCFVNHFCSKFINKIISSIAEIELIHGIVKRFLYFDSHQRSLIKADTLEYNKSIF